jgi:hypothetical protein
MGITQPNESKITNWEILPESVTLLQYLNRADLIELSCCCKRYRNQFERIVLRNLNDSGYDVKRLDNYLILGKEHSFDNFIFMLERDLGNKVKYVKEFNFWGSLSRELARNIATLLPNINRIRFFYWCENESELGLITLLDSLKNLKHIEFDIIDEDLPDIESSEQIFPNTLCSIKVNIANDAPYFVPIFNTIDSSYANLTSLSIVSNKMLTNLAHCIQSLSEVEVINHWDLDDSVLLEFIKQNPQLAKLEINFNKISGKILESILSSKCLSYFSIIKNRYYFNEEFNYFPINYSIKKLRLRGIISAELALKIINSCKNLKNLELINCNFLRDKFEWDNINQKISNIHFINCYCNGELIQTLDKLQIFDKGIFSHCYGTHGPEGFNLKNFARFPFTSTKPNSFIIKIINDK